MINNIKENGREDKSGWKTSDVAYQISREQAEDWFGYLSLIIKQSESMDVVDIEEEMNQVEEILPIQEEIKALKELLENGEINNEEFKKKRRELLLKS